MWKYYSIPRFDGSSSVDMPVTGQVGDFIGGVVGTLWAFSTVIFLYVSLKIQGNEINEQNIRWETQRIEDLYFKLIENYNSIAFIQPPGERARPLFNLTTNIKEVLMGKFLLRNISKQSKTKFFFPYQDEQYGAFRSHYYLSLNFFINQDVRGF
ncbi:MAG: hypothetical protein IPK21_22940 [Haliscomenobacter sp.]|nr:hypothetical protein [Haliscomenobacter sp.]